MVVQGSLTVDLDNGEEQQSVDLAAAGNVLCIHAGVHLRLRNFAPGTILMVMASRPYNEASRRDHPQRELLGQGWPGQYS